MATVVVRADTTLAVAVTGVRRQGAPDAVQPTDRFHIGSNGKAMAATVIARLVEEGHITWSTRPVDVFPELGSSVHHAYRDVTLQQLLGHRAGLPPYTTEGPIRDAERRRDPADPLHVQRRAFGVRLLRQPPHVAAGTFTYSNAGYSLAAAMAEAAAGEPWESLVQSRLARPLGIHLSRSQPARTDAAQPWGHRSRYALGFIPLGQYAPDPHDAWDIGPLFVSAGDLALSAGDYALGWGKQTFDGMAARTHMGSEGTFTAGVLLLPEHDMAVAVLINSATPGADRAAREAVKTLLRMHTSAPSGSPP